MKIDGVIFDLDHTLFDRYETVKLCTPMIYEKLKNIINSEYTLEKFTDFFIETDKLKIHYGWEAVFNRYIEKGVFMPNTDFSLRDFLDAIFEAYEKFSVKYSFTENVLKTLKDMGLKTGLITNGSSSLQRAKLANLGIEKYFDIIYISGEIGIQKPDIEIFKKLSEEIKISPQRLLYVGDHPINDATASSQAGYIPVLVMTMGFETMPCAKDFKFKINDISELVDLIKSNFS